MITMSPTLSLEALVANTPDLPTLPAAVIAVIQETESPTGSAQTVAQALSKDPALAARVLRLANSAYYSLARQVMSIPEAVVVLGMRTVRNLAMIAGSYPWMIRPFRGYDLGPHELWAHSLAVAVASQSLARRCRLSEAEAFSAGLFHNIGKAVLSIWLEAKMPILVSPEDAANLPFDQIEKRTLGYDHTEVGAHVAEMWNLPKPLIRVIRYHHDPDLGAPNPLLDCVHIADFLAMSAGFNPGSDGLRYEVSAGAFNRAGIEPGEIPTLLEEFLQIHEGHSHVMEELAKAA
jgi:putative nucleotidyltransferase with HDIG domain